MTDLFITQPDRSWPGPHAIHALWVCAAERAVPPRPKTRPPVDCPTCDDHKTVSRIRGGIPFPESCPDCTKEPAQ